MKLDVSRVEFLERLLDALVSPSDQLRDACAAVAADFLDVAVAVSGRTQHGDAPEPRRELCEDVDGSFKLITLPVVVNRVQRLRGMRGFPDLRVIRLGSAPVAEDELQRANDLVFGHPRTGRPLDQTKVTRRFKKACRDAGV